MGLNEFVEECLGFVKDALRGLPLGRMCCHVRPGCALGAAVLGAGSAALCAVLVQAGLARWGKGKGFL